MWTASQLIDRLGERLTEGLPVRPGIVLRVTERPGAAPNWAADISMPLPLAIAERWSGAVVELQWSAPAVDFSDATEEQDGAPSLSRDLSVIRRTGEENAGREGGAAVAMAPGGSDQASSLLRWLAGIPAALAILAAAFIALAE